MSLEGTVTNVAAFGAFVNIGVHQDGLVHVSAMSKTFVKDPREVVKPGDIVRVKVLEVDKARKRIALTAKKGAVPAQPRAQAAIALQRRSPTAAVAGAHQHCRRTEIDVRAILERTLGDAATG